MTSRAERADAARNRVRILAAADDLFAIRPPGSVTMEEIARVAGVGKGTLYRRYPSPHAIAVALLDEHERELQQEMLSGDPPLGPGAPAGERLAAFYAVMTDLLEKHGHLALAAEAGARRFVTGAYGFWRAHVGSLLSETGVESSERSALIDALLAPLAPELYQFQRQELRLSQAEIRKGLRLLAHRVLPQPRPG